MALTLDYTYYYQGTYDQINYTFETSSGAVAVSTSWTDDITGDNDGAAYHDEVLREPNYDIYMYFHGFTADGSMIAWDITDATKFQLYSNNPAITPGTIIPVTEGDMVFCFAGGTLISTPDGSRPVESLEIGEPILTADGRCVPVKWIGRQTINPLFARITSQLPVRIGAGALGENLPTRDLFVSPDHAISLGGCLVHALALVNGRTITQLDTWPGDIEYFHIETEAHEIILAEGAPAETFIDNVSREKFDNHAEFLRLYPDAQPMVELDMPRIKFARQLPMAIRRSLEHIADDLLGPLEKAA